MRKQSEVTAQTKQNLIDAFWQLYSIKRIDRITVKEIASLAGYNRGTFYEYFADVFDVLRQIEDSLLPGPDELPPLSLSGGELSFSIDAFVKMYSSHSNYYAVLLGDDGDPSFPSRMKNSLRPMLKSKLTAGGVADDLGLDYAIELILSAMIGVLNYWFNQEKRPPIEDLIKWIYDLMEHGFLKRYAGMLDGAGGGAESGLA